MRRTSVHIRVGKEFYELLERERKLFQKKIGLSKNISQVDFTTLLKRSGIKFPKINIKII